MTGLKPHIPDALPLQGLNYEVLSTLIGKANNALGKYDGLLQGIPNPDVMLSPLQHQEAVLSSRIEGTQATLVEVLEQEAGLEKTGEKYDDIQEIINYRNALQHGKDQLQAYPIRLSFIRELHKILLSGTRGKDKSPGELRKTQNWIGDAGCTLEQAAFVPPSPLQLDDFLQAWETYMDGEDTDVLLQTAIMHAQFELIHPFEDGNGRIGRILIPLFLFQKKALSQPMFYLSEYLENHRDAYYQRLRDISQKQDWNGWIVFFLHAITMQATQNSIRVLKIMQLYEYTKGQIQNVTHSQYNVHLLDAIFKTPIFQVSWMADRLNKKYGMREKTAADLLRQLKDANILAEIQTGRGQRSAVFSFTELWILAQGGTA